MRLATFAALLTGCGAAGSDCPPVVHYADALQDKLASELNDMDSRGLYPAVQRALVEYGQLRAMVRACRP